MALYVSGLCDLVRATCAAGWITSYAGLAEAGVPGNSWCHFAIPGLYRFLDLPDVACLSVPRALFLLGLDNDPVFPAHSHGTFDRIRTVYENAEHGDDFSWQIYSGEPRFSAQMLADTLHWFQRWL